MRKNKRTLSSKLTRTNTITANALLNKIGSYRLGEANHCGLGGAVHTSIHNTCVRETHVTHTHIYTQIMIRGLQ